MRVDKLVLKNFRNYESLAIHFTNNIHILIGANAQGKTNILEAIYVSSMGKSHRAFDESELIRLHQDAGYIELSFKRQDTENVLTFKFINGQNKEILLNSHPIKKKELIGQFNTVLFSPEDLQLAKGSPQLRRKFLDDEISQANPAYYRQLTQLNRILSQRNNLLKKVRERQADAAFLETWNEQLAKAAALVTAKRLEAVKKFNMLANLMHRKLTANKENLTVVYQLHKPVECTEDNLYEFYRKSLRFTQTQDIMKGSTSVGPHRDDLLLAVNGQNLRIYGSQGQQRTGVLALKLAELEFIKSETGEYPVLLLDDVMSELDSSRREHLLNFIRDKIQTFITATDSTYFPDIQSASFYRVSEGKVTV